MIRVGDRVEVGINSHPQGRGGVVRVSDDGKWVDVRLDAREWPITAFRAADLEVIPIIDDLVGLA